jgi:hypothetical protein
MRRLAALGFLLVACSSQPQPVAVSTSSAAAAPSPASCRLAVIQGSRGQGAGPQTPGFLNLRDLTFSADPSAGDGMFYDKPLKRWVPWGPPALSADGASYAYVDGDQTSSRIHIVDVRTNVDMVLASGGPWRLAGLQPDAAYVMGLKYLPYSEAYGVMAVGTGLWKVPLTGGDPKQLTNDSRNWPFVTAGAAWGDSSTYDVAGGPNDVVRLDLKTLQTTIWLDPGMRSYLLGFDAGGAPLIASSAAGEHLWHVRGPGEAVELWSGPANGVRPYAPLAADAGTTWFSSINQTLSWSIFRYTAATGMKVVANFTDHPVTVAGPCA